MAITETREEGEEEQTSKKAKTIQQPQQEVDRIGQLPDDILHRIMSLLTLKEACITTALSKRWGTLFPSLPRLHFDFYFGYSSARDQEIDIDCWIEWVRGILVSRRAPVRICTISSSNFYLISEDLGKIIRFLCNNGIQELTLSNLGLEHYPVPSCLYSCSSATRIELCMCLLKVPSEFCLLRRLNVLLLDQCVVEDGDMQRLILSCPAVERLTLRRCLRLRNFEVHADKLAVLEVDTYSPLALSILRAPRLESIIYRFFFACDQRFLFPIHDILPGDEDKYTDEDEVRRLVVLVESLGNTQNLELKFNTLLKDAAVPATLRPVLSKMKKLTLRVLPYGTYELSVLSCLLNCCPNLEDLVLGDKRMIGHPVTDDSLLDYWNQQMPSDCVRNTLSTVTLCVVDHGYYWKFVVELVKFLLNNACVLKNLIIDCDLEKKKMSEMVKYLQREMLLLSPASPDVVMKFKAAGSWMVYRPAQLTFGAF